MNQSSEGFFIGSIFVLIIITMFFKINKPTVTIAEIKIASELCSNNNGLRRLELAFNSKIICKNKAVFPFVSKK